MLTLTVRTTDQTIDIMVRPQQKIGEVLKVLKDNRQLGYGEAATGIFSSRKREYISPEHSFKQENIYNGDILLLREDGVNIGPEEYADISEYRKYIRKDITFINGTDGDIIIQGMRARLILEESILTVSGDIEGLYLNGEGIKRGETKINEGDRLTIADTRIVIGRNYIRIAGDGLTVALKSIEDKQDDDFPIFRRPPRTVRRPAMHRIDIEAEPSVDEGNKRGLMQLLISPLIMLAVTVIVSIVLKRGMYIIMSIGFTIAAAVVSVVRFIQERKELKARNKDREKNYRDYLLGIRRELYDNYINEEESYGYNYPEFEDLYTMAAEYSSRTYERSSSDQDFLNLAVGNHIGSSELAINTGSRELRLEKKKFTDELIRLKNKYSVIKMPQVIDLKTTNIGLTGDKRVILPQLKYYICQLAFFHSYHELQFVCVYDTEDADEFKWMQWLKHAKISGLNIYGLVNGDGNGDQVLNSMQQILKERMQKVAEEKKSSRFLPYYVFVIADEKLIYDHSITEYLNKEGLKDIEVSLIYMADSKEELPENIRTVISYDNSKEALLVIKDNEPVNRRLLLRNVTDVDTESFARNLSVIEHELSAKGRLKDSITFMEMYGVGRIEELDILKRWRISNSSRSLAVPLGVRAGGEELRLNLHETAHGPHGLIAGTTGSGKSELVQSYILSLAINFHPYEVGFLLIDYKGGGMANLFKDLPHLMGTITNLDGGESLRALASIQSELRRRQRIFGEYEVNHINAYNELYKEGEADEPLPHLFIISDEFAELKKEQPEFMKELVSTARIGRSLGVHLILATQKPTGIVDDQIWSNSRFKICLKVQDEGDSREILHTPDAAGITQPGRAYLQVGNNEIYELFQSAWSGAMYVEETGEDVTADKRVYKVNGLGQGELINTDLHDALGDEGAGNTQLEAIVSEIRSIADSLGLKEIKKPWLPMLPDKLVLEACTEKDHTDRRRADLAVNIGRVDIPELQEQSDYIVDMETHGNIVYIASPGFGKTVFLETVIMNLVNRNRVRDMNLYILDFGSNALITLSRLPHVADYIMLDDTEKYEKFMNLIANEIRKRKKLFAERMVQNYSVYNETSDTPLKAIVIIIDSYDAVKEMGFEMEEYYTKLTRDGVSLGIYTVITASRSSSVRMATMNNFKNKIAGYNFDEMEAKSLIGRCEYSLPETKGRAYVKTGSGVNIMQIYTPVDYTDEVDYNRRLTEAVSSVCAMYPGEEAEHIRMLPEELTYPLLSSYDREGEDIVFGLYKDSVSCAGISMSEMPFLVLGDASSGKTNALKLILEQIPEYVEVHLFDSRSRGLIEYRNRCDYISEVSSMETFIEELPEEIRKREAYREACSQDEAMSYEEPKPMLIMIDDLDDLYDLADAQMSIVGTRLRKAAVNGIMLVVSAGVNSLKGQDDLTRYIKSIRNGLLLSTQSYLSIFPVKASDVIRKPDGVLMKDGQVRMIRVAEILDSRKRDDEILVMNSEKP